MIDRYQLRYFLAVVDAGNFSRAALQVNVAQPTLSIGIAKLEAHLGSKLFLRNSQRVQLTEAGVRFLEHARSIEDEFSHLESRLTGLKLGRLVRLGVLTTLPTAMVQTIVERHLARAGHDRVEIVDGAERELVARLDRGRIDLALTVLRDTASRKHAEPLFHEGYSLAVSADHRHAQSQIVAGEDLAAEVMIVRRHCEALAATSRHFIELGVRPEFSYRSTNDDRVLAMVRAGLGITVMPDSYQDPGVRRPRLAGFDLQRRIGLLYGERAAELREQGGSIVDAIRTFASSSQAGSAAAT